MQAIATHPMPTATPSAQFVRPCVVAKAPPGQQYLHYRSYGSEIMTDHTEALAWAQHHMCSKGLPHLLLDLTEVTGLHPEQARLLFGELQALLQAAHVRRFAVVLPSMLLLRGRYMRWLRAMKLPVPGAEYRFFTCPGEASAWLATP